MTNEPAPLMPPGPECLTYPCGCQGSPASEVPNYCQDHGKSPFNRGFQRTAKPEPETDAPKGWAIDYSTGSPILTYEACSVIQDEQAHLVMDLLGRAAKPQAAPLVPPMPDPFAYGSDVWDIRQHPYVAQLMAHARQCAEIAQAQARRAEKAESAIQDVHSALGNEIAHEGVRLKAMRVRSERDALKARVAELEAEAQEARDEAREVEGVEGANGLTLVGVIRALSFKISNLRDSAGMERRERTSLAADKLILRTALAQRDREVLALRRVLQDAYNEEPDAHFADDAHELLKSTVQAGAESERRLLEAAWKRLLAAFPPDGVEGEIVQGAKAAMLGTGGEDK